MFRQRGVKFVFLISNRLFIFGNDKVPFTFFFEVVLYKN